MKSVACLLCSGYSPLHRTVCCEKRAFRAQREMLGGRLRAMLISGAEARPEVLKFARCVFGVEVLNISKIKLQLSFYFSFFELFLECTCTHLLVCRCLTATARLKLPPSSHSLFVPSGKLVPPPSLALPAVPFPTSASSSCLLLLVISDHVFEENFQYSLLLFSRSRGRSGTL